MTLVYHSATGFDENLILPFHDAKTHDIYIYIYIIYIFNIYIYMPLDAENIYRKLERIYWYKSDPWLSFRYLRNISKSLVKAGVTVGGLENNFEGKGWRSFIFASNQKMQKQKKKKPIGSTKTLGNGKMCVFFCVNEGNFFHGFWQSSIPSLVLSEFSMKWR